MKIADALKHIDWTILDELEHIPAGKAGSLQAALRVEYAQYRTIHRQLNARLPARAALIQAVYELRRTNPEFEPRYDAPFFYEGSLMSRALSSDPLAEEIHATAAKGGDSTRVPEAHGTLEFARDSVAASSTVDITEAAFSNW